MGRSRDRRGHALIVDGLRGRRPGRYVLQAAIAALYAEAPTYDQTDWPQIVTMYDALLEVWPSPVVALSRAVAVAMVSGPSAALAQVEELERDPRLAGYHYLPAIKADLLRRVGPAEEAAAAYRGAGADHERGRTGVPGPAPRRLRPAIGLPRPDPPVRASLA